MDDTRTTPPTNAPQSSPQNQRPWSPKTAPVPSPTASPSPPTTPPTAQTPEDLPAASSPELRASVSSNSRRRDQVLYVRVNRKEKESIIARAHRCRLSLSRYLARRALEEQPPPTEEERRRLEGLLHFFKRTEASLRRLRTEALRLKLFTVVPGIEEDLDTAFEAVTGLIRELSKRL
jgi:hypothetical protein